MRKKRKKRKEMKERRKEKVSLISLVSIQILLPPVPFFLAGHENSAAGGAES